MFKTISLFFKRLFIKKIEPISRYYKTENYENYYMTALSQLGVKEYYGKKHNPKIIEYHSTTTLRALTDETPWCSAFVNWCLEKNGIIGTRSASARSWENYGQEVNAPTIGKTIVVFWRVRRDGWQGHVGFYSGENKDSILVLGGNQGDEVCCQYYPKKQFLKYINP